MYQILSLVYWTDFFLCMCTVHLCRSADPVWCQPLHHLLGPGPGCDREPGWSRGSGLHPHLVRLVFRSGLALLQPGGPHQRTAAHSCSFGQVAAQQSDYSLTPPLQGMGGLVMVMFLLWLQPCSPSLEQGNKQNGHKLSLWHVFDWSLAFFWSDGAFRFKLDQLLPLVVPIETAPHNQVPCGHMDAYCSLAWAKLNFWTFRMVIFDSNSLLTHFSDRNLFFQHNGIFKLL